MENNIDEAKKKLFAKAFDAKTMGVNMMTETKESNIPETLSAGTFVDRPFLDRINPFTPFSAKKFVPNENAKNRWIFKKSRN